MAEDQISRDLPIFFDLLGEFQGKIGEVTKLVKEVETRVLSGEFNTKKGISLLDVKYHLLLWYLIDLCQCILLKTEGRSIEDSDAVNRLVETRVVLEKLRPLEQKLKYQIDKLVKLTTSGAAGLPNDPLRFKPNPDNLISKLLDSGAVESDQEDEDKNGKDAVGVYVPPRVTAVPFEEDGKRTRQQKEDERVRKRALSSAMLRELRDEFSDGPEEISFHDLGGSHQRKRELEKEKERLQYEEDRLLRLPNAKNLAKKARTSEQELDDLTQFDDLSVLAEPGKQMKRRTMGSSTKAKKRGMRRRTARTRKKH